MTIASRVSPMVLPVLTAAAVLLPASTAFADTVVAGNQIVQGAQCVGVTCANGESFTGNLPQLMVKAADTPACG